MGRKTGVATMQPSQNEPQAATHPSRAPSWGACTAAGRHQSDGWGRARRFGLTPPQSRYAARGGGCGAPGCKACW